MEEAVQVSESQAVQEPTSKNGSVVKSEKESCFEAKTPQETYTQENGGHLGLQKSPKCDSNEIKMEERSSSADPSALESLDKSKPHQNGPTEKEKPPDSSSHSESPSEAEAQVMKHEKTVPKSEIQSVKSESLNSVSSKNGNVTTCGPFMSSIDAVINSVAHNIPPDEPSNFDSNPSAKSTANDSRAVPSYDHSSHYMHQTNPKQTHVPQTYGDRTINQPYNTQMYQHMKGQPIPSSANYGIPTNPHHASASEQLSSLVKSHVLDTGSEPTTDQQTSAQHPGVRPEMHPNIPPPTSMYNHQPMYRPVYDPNSGLPMHPPGPGDMHQQRAPGFPVRPQNEIHPRHQTATNSTERWCKTAAEAKSTSTRNATGYEAADDDGPFQQRHATRD